ncbi:MAG: hypothetical protein GEU99_02645 [Luteitalea sp.]|nr:hypothetical protein [Luteitalea sp.]
MAYFVATADQRADPEKLKNLLENKQLPSRIPERDEIRIEAENFRELEGFELNNVGTMEVSQRLNCPAGERGNRTHSYDIL